MRGEATPAQIGGFLVALRLKGETPDEIAGCAEAMREPRAAVRPERDDWSTPPARAATAPTRSTSRRRRRSWPRPPAQASRSTGTAPSRPPLARPTCSRHSDSSSSSRRGAHRPVDRRAGLRLHVRAGAPPRDAPCGAGAARARRAYRIQCARPARRTRRRPAQVIGVYSPSLVRTIAEVLAQLGARRAFVVHGAHGIDELSPAGPNDVCEVVDGEVRERVIDPLELGIQPLRPGRAQRAARRPRTRRRSATCWPARTAAGATRSS